MRVVKWGDSLAIHLPTEVVEILGLKEGDEVTVRVAGKDDFSVAKKPDREVLLRRIRELRVDLPTDFKFDREEANAR